MSYHGQIMGGAFTKNNNKTINMGDKLDPTPLENSSAMVPITSSAAVPLAAPIPDKAVGAVVFPEVDIRYWLDGTAPTTTSGILCPAFGQITLDSRAECDGFKAIAVSSSGNMARYFNKLSEVS